MAKNLPWRLYDGHQDIIGLGLIEHNPVFINKTYSEAAFQLFPEKTHQTRSSKFRRDTDFFPLKLYRYYSREEQKFRRYDSLLLENRCI